MIEGSLLIAAICGWAVVTLAAQLRRHVQSQTAVDRTLREVSFRDAPGLFALQCAGLVAAIVAAAGIGIGALIIGAARFVQLLAG